MTFLRIKTIKNKKYLYRQTSVRKGKKVKSIMQYVCSLGWIGVASVSPGYVGSRGHASTDIPPKSNRNDPVCFSPYLYRARNRVDGSSTGSSNVVGSGRATTGLPPTTSPLSNLHLSGYGCALMSPRPS
jgi:hypothetical protein